MATGQAFLYLVLDRKGQRGIRRETTKPSRIACEARIAPSVASAVHLCSEDGGFRNGLPGPQAFA